MIQNNLLRDIINLLTLVCHNMINHIEVRLREPGGAEGGDKAEQFCLGEGTYQGLQGGYMGLINTCKNLIQIT